MPQLGSRWPHCSICYQEVVAAEVLKKVKVLRRSDNLHWSMSDWAHLEVVQWKSNGRRGQEGSSATMKLIGGPQSVPKSPDYWPIYDYHPPAMEGGSPALPLFIVRNRTVAACALQHDQGCWDGPGARQTWMSIWRSWPPWVQMGGRHWCCIGASSDDESCCCWTAWIFIFLGAGALPSLGFLLFLACCLKMCTFLVPFLNDSSNRAAGGTWNGWSLSGWWSTALWPHSWFHNGVLPAWLLPSTFITIPMILPLHCVVAPLFATVALNICISVVLWV